MTLPPCAQASWLAVAYEKAKDSNKDLLASIWRRRFPEGILPATSKLSIPNWALKRVFGLARNLQGRGHPLLA